MDAASRELARNNSCGTLGCTAARFIVRLRHGVDSIYRRLIEPVPGASLPDRPGVGQRNAVACMPARRWTRRCHPARGSCFLWRARNAHQQDEYTVARICHLCSKRSASGLQEEPIHGHYGALSIADEVVFTQAQRLRAWRQLPITKEECACSTTIASRTGLGRLC